MFEELTKNIVDAFIAEFNHRKEFNDWWRWYGFDNQETLKAQLAKLASEKIEAYFKTTKGKD